MSVNGIQVGGGLFGGESIPVMESLLRYTSQRQLVLLNNVANWNTPNFKARDLSENDFQIALSDAIERRESGDSPLGISTGRNISRSEDGSFRIEPRSVNSGIMRHDGNTVVIDQEQSKLLKNAMTAQIFNRLLARKYRSLRSAIAGRIT